MKRRSAPSPAHVLVVDDHADSVEIVRHVLEWGGLSVQAATNGKDAINLALSNPPAAIFLDINMPQLSGIDVLRALRENPATRRIAVAALTGVPELLDGVTDLKFDWVLTKPVAPDELVRVARILVATAGLAPDEQAT